MNHKKGTTSEPMGMLEHPKPEASFRPLVSQRTLKDPLPELSKEEPLNLFKPPKTLHTCP